MQFVANLVERANAGEHLKVSFRKLRHAQSQIRNRAERTLLTRLDQRFSRSLLQPLPVAQPKTQREFSSIMLKGAIPVRAGYIHRLYAQAVALRVFHQGCRRIKPHWPVIEQGSSKGGQITDL